MSVRDRALLTGQYSHIVATFIRLSEPKRGAQMWADAQLQIAFEETATGTVVPLMMLSAMLLYTGANYAHACHLAQLERAINEINAGMEEWRSSYPAELDGLDKMAAKGSVAIDIRTMVPKTQAAKVRYGIQLHVNDSKKTCTIAEAIRATNPEMVRQLGLAIKDIYAKASPASAMTAQPTN